MEDYEFGRRDKATWMWWIAWPNLIILFELTMLGAIVATVAALVVTARLGRHLGLYDREVSDGKILVGIERPPDSAITELQTALGAVRHALVKTI